MHAFSLGAEAEIHSSQKGLSGMRCVMKRGLSCTNCRSSNTSTPLRQSHTSRSRMRERADVVCGGIMYASLCSPTPIAQNY